MDLRADGGGALILSDGTGGEVQWDISDEGLCVHAESISTSECFEYQLDGDRLEIGEAVYQRQDATIPIQTTTPKPTLIPTPAPEPILLSGSGDSIIDIEKWLGPAVVHIIGNASSVHFAVKALNSAGKQLELLANTSEPYDGVRPLDFADAQQTARFEVTATGNWTIEVLPLIVDNLTVVNVPGSIAGTGDAVLLLDNDADIATITGNATGSHFAVHSYSGTSSDLLVNTADPYDGQVQIGPGERLLVITAIGDWTIDLTAR